ncbi:M20/M25/M40 family metallo-hydrolase [Desulfosporosinus youngiae]|nr:M20/M25/M40 family metallo-hydrolase [Desulfosporosinus youngiae]
MAIDWEDIKREMIRYLRDLIRIDTSAGRDGETRAAHYLRAVLEANNLPAEVREPVPGKGSLICRRPGRVPDQSLLLLSHLDAAPVDNPAEWQYPPFSGAYQAGEIWGRGAVDCKGLAVVWLMLVLLIQRQRIPIKRGLVYAATADEESGGRWGVEWLLEHTGDLLGCPYALNEGGGFSFHHRKGEIYTCQYGEKGSLVLDCRIQSHNSVHPFSGAEKVRIKPENAKLIQPVLDALGRINNIPPGLISWLPYGGKAALLKGFSGLPFDYATLMYNTLKLEILPPPDGQGSVLRVHLSAVPGESLAELKEKVFQQGLILPGQVSDVRTVSAAEANSSPLDTSLYPFIRRAIEQKGSSGGVLLPFVTPGVTDSRHLRARGIICYGFFPTPPETDIRLIHKANERISAEALVFALGRLYEVVIPFLTADDF